MLAGVARLSLKGIMALKHNGQPNEQGGKTYFMISPTQTKKSERRGERVNQLLILYFSQKLFAHNLPKSKKFGFVHYRN